ncbi:MAG: proline--tRNA ligase [Myxococcales bacterium]
MRLSAFHAPTLKEAPKDAELPSHELLIRGGFIRKVAAGVYSFLPLGVRVLSKIEAIVREEMNRAGAMEVLMPTVQPAELWQESGRWAKYGPELLRFKDRKGSEFCLGPTHEEVVVDLVRRDVRSYRQLPINLYQIQGKFRDELRPRGGLMRGREFIMKDAYSFDATLEAARRSYDRMHEAYTRIFTRCGLDFRVVEADTGNIGGSASHEFQVLAETGEDSIVSCSTCPYTANVEKAELKPAPLAGAGEDARAPRLVATPRMRTVEEVTAFLGVPPERLIKTLLFIADGSVVAALVRGDHELNEIKLKAALGASDLGLADEDTVRRVTGAPVGFAGPVGLPGDVRIVADHSLLGQINAVVGANQADTHLVDVTPGRDFQVAQAIDLRTAVGGEACPRCGEGTFSFFRGIEVGHIFLLGTRYSEPMRCTFLDEAGKEQVAVMGCYGIGVTRILSAAIEQHHDKGGIRFPPAIAPFQVVVMALNVDDPTVRAEAERLYRSLLEAGVDALYDDREERPGAKFKDADLMGTPVQVVVGRKSLEAGGVELKRRSEDTREVIPPDQVVAAVQSLLAASHAEQEARLGRG